MSFDVAILTLRSYHIAFKYFSFQRLFVDTPVLRLLHRMVTWTHQRQMPSLQTSATTKALLMKTCIMRCSLEALLFLLPYVGSPSLDLWIYIIGQFVKAIGERWPRIYHSWRTGVWGLSRRYLRDENHTGWFGRGGWTNSTWRSASSGDLLKCYALITPTHPSLSHPIPEETSLHPVVNLACRSISFIELSEIQSYWLTTTGCAGSPACLLFKGNSSLHALGRIFTPHNTFSVMEPSFAWVMKQKSPNHTEFNRHLIRGGNEGKQMDTN